MNKILLLVIIVIAVAVIGAVWWSYSQTSSGAEINIEPVTYDFGEIGLDKVRHTFLISNTGTANLEIFNVTTSCNCTTASVAQEVISPNETTDLRVEFDPEFHEDTEGEILREIYVRSNDKDNSEATVTIIANVIR